MKMEIELQAESAELRLAAANRFSKNFKDSDDGEVIYELTSTFRN